MKRKIFYSFHYDNDVFRVQLIRNIGALEGNKPVTPNKWEEIKRGGEAAVKKWIDENLRGKSCLVVLVGTHTAERKWVNYEITHAWENGLGVLGVYIHNLKDPRYGTCSRGKNPFSNYCISNTSDYSIGMDKVVKCYDPMPENAYQDIAANLEGWVEEAILIRQRYS